MQAIYKQKCMENIRNRLQSLPWVHPKADFGSDKAVCLALHVRQKVCADNPPSQRKHPL